VCHSLSNVIRGHCCASVCSNSDLSSNCCATMNPGHAGCLPRTRNAIDGQTDMQGRAHNVFFARARAWTPNSPFSEVHSQVWCRLSLCSMLTSSLHTHCIVICVVIKAIPGNTLKEFRSQCLSFFNQLYIKPNVLTHMLIPVLPSPCNLFYL
jgi:hypothetical protein